jgi:hypothetical protein
MQIHPQKQWNYASGLKWIALSGVLLLCLSASAQNNLQKGWEYFNKNDIPKAREYFTKASAEQKDKA